MFLLWLLGNFERSQIPEDVAGGGDGGCGLSPGLGPVEDDGVPRVARTALPQVTAFSLDAKTAFAWFDFWRAPYSSINPGMHMEIPKES